MSLGVDTSGAVMAQGRPVKWQDLDRFTQASLLVLLRGFGVGYSDLSWEALAQIIVDARFAQSNGHQVDGDRSDFDRGWDFSVERQEGVLACFSPLAAIKGNDGKYQVRPAPRRGRAA